MRDRVRCAHDPPQLQSCERQLDESLCALEATSAATSADVHWGSIHDACECIAELYRVPTVQQSPVDNTFLHSLLARMHKVAPKGL